MNVREMIELLEDYDDDMEVRLATQPSWPFEWTVAGVTSRGESQAKEIMRASQLGPDADVDYGGEWLVLEDGEITMAFDSEEEARAEVHGGRDPDCVFILEGTQLQYASKNLWR